MQKISPRAHESSLGQSRENNRKLDWFIFFIADVQTGFGPFLSVYLTTEKWTQSDIGLILSVGSAVGLLSQIPAGWVLDRTRYKQRAAGLAVTAIGASALLIALSSLFVSVLAAKILHVLASAILGPAIATISMMLVAERDIGVRLGRNARFASVGNGVAAAIMGTCGYFLSAQYVFFVTALLAVPALVALLRIRLPVPVVSPIDAAPVFPTASRRVGGGRFTGVLWQPALLILIGAVMLFQMANAAMLPLVGSAMAMKTGSGATFLVAICIVVPQLILAAISPSVGSIAETWGRRPLLLIGFGLLLLRGLLLATVHNSGAIVATQMLDGVSAAVIGIIVPLVVADLTRATGHFNLALGAVGSAGGVGAAVSTYVAGNLTDNFGASVAFLGLAGAAAAGLLLLWIAMPESKHRVR
jgi:MFS family permease